MYFELNIIFRENYKDNLHIKYSLCLGHHDFNLIGLAQYIFKEICHIHNYSLYLIKE